MCKAYYDYRPAGRCEIMETESIEKHGDPHFVTLNGTSYTFHGQGEFTLVSLPKLNGQEVQIRLASNEDLTKTDSIIGIVAFAIGYLNGMKRVQFELFPTHQLLEIRIDSRLIELPHEEFAVSIIIYEDQYVKIKRKNNGAFRISFPASPLRFRVHIHPTFDFLQLETLLEREKFIKLSTPSYGLLGDINGLEFPNGTRLSINQTDENILHEYGQSWRISRNSSLFYYLIDEQYNKQILTHQLNCYDDTSQEENEYCIKHKRNSENDIHRLHQSDSHHWESLSVTIEPDVLPQNILNDASNHIYSNFIFQFLLFYSLLRIVFI
jgi:hypothetical protein